MFNLSKFVLLNKKTLNNNNILNINKKLVSSRNHHSYFDIHLNWYANLFKGKSISLARSFAIINVALFLYVNLRYNKERRWQVLDGVSWSVRSQKSKEYIPAITSLLGARRLDDMLLETGILYTIGHQLEKHHGTPFFVKLSFFALYIGYLSSLFWVNKQSAKRKRFYVEEPLKREFDTPQSYDYKFMSSHGLAMSVLYFWLFKNAQFRKFIIPLAIVDLYVWGPYYAPGALVGIGAGMIL